MSSPGRQMKRSLSSPKRAAKKSKITKLIPTVVDALADAEALPADLRSLLKGALPFVLSADKAERDPYEVEIVDQAQKSLAAVLSELEVKHREATTVQDGMISASEHAGRVAKKKDAEAALEAAKAKLETCKEAKSSAQKAMHDAQQAHKTAKKEAEAADKEVQSYADKKAALSNFLATEFALLRDGSSAGAAGKKAVQKTLQIGKEFSLDATLLQTFPMTCKKPSAERTEFEALMFTSLQSAIDKSIDALTAKIVEVEPVKAQKEAAVASAKEASDQAEAALTKAAEELQAAQEASKESSAEVKKAEKHLYEIWNDMKKACDAQDSLAGEIQNFKGNILTAFEQLKEKEPEAEPVVEEAAPETLATEAAEVASANASDAAPVEASEPAATAPAEAAAEETAPMDA